VSEVFEYISWVKDWEGSAENPTELLTSFTIMNISDYLIPNLLRLARQTENNEISFENYEIKVLGILADLIKSKSREVEAISEFQWRTIGDIVALLLPCVSTSHISGASPNYLRLLALPVIVTNICKNCSPLSVANLVRGMTTAIDFQR
jgi:hypothetical protein